MEIPDTVKAVLDAQPDAAVVVDAERRIVLANRAYRQLAPRAEAGKHCYDVFPLEVCQTACVSCRATEADEPVRVDRVGAQGGLSFAVTAAPVDGFVVESYRDVTADQRKYKTLEAQLIHQEKMSSLGRLVAGIAHELNNPINFVYGNVDFLGRYLEDLLGLVALYDKGAGKAEIEERKEKIELDYLIEDSRKLIRSIRSGAERTASIVRDLKAFSRTSSGPMRESDVVAGIETTLNLLAPLVKNRIVVEKHYAEPHPLITCQAGHVNQVIMNIVTNAAQAIDGEGKITVSVTRAGDGVEIAIADTGRGIPREIQEKIFDPFFTTKDVGEGTGLGLAISESIVRAHGGHIRCESEPGKGATFTITLPAKPPRDATS